MLLALRDHLAAADGAPIRLRELARALDADPAVVRSVLAHATARGWLPEVAVTDTDGCGTPGCEPTPTSVLCRGCPLAP